MGEKASIKSMIRLSLAAGMLWAALPGTAQEPSGSVEQELAELRAEVEELSKFAVRTQSHVMMDVEYHFTNLWFAAHDARWDLAAFYARETLSHINWAVRMRPVRSVNGGGEVDLRPLRQAIEQGGFAELQEAVEQKDVQAFEAAYTDTLGQCRACHEASGRGYLALKKPRAPAAPLVFGEE